MSRDLKFKQIEIKSFRGIRDLTLNLDSKSLVVCGPNGTGKSSITQAFEYLFTGKVSALTGIRGLNHDNAIIHKGDKKSDVLVRAKIKKNTIERSFKNGVDFGNLTLLEEDFKNGSFILNRKKLLSIIDTRPGERYKQIASIIGFEKYDDIEKKLKAGRDALNKELKLKNEEMDSILSEIISTYECEEENILLNINSLLDKNGIGTINNETDLKEFMKENKFIDSAKIFKIDIAKTNEKYLSLLGKYEDLLLNERKSANSLLSLLNESKDYIITENSSKCPVCQNDIEIEKVLNEINPKIKEIKKDLNSFDEWKEEIDEVIEELLDINYKIKAFNSSNPQLELEYDLTETTKSLKELSNYDKRISEMDKTILISLEESIASLKEEYDSNQDELSQTLDNIFKLIEIEEIKKDIEKLEIEFDIANKTFEIFTKVRQEEIGTILDNIKDLTAQYYNFIHSDDEIINPDITLSSSKSLILKLLFEGESFDPRTYSSEGHIDSLGLCLFLAFVKTYNEHRFIILDDIISTVDLGHKEQIIRLLFKEFGNYTFIITTHNKLWFEQLFRLSKSHKKEGKFNFVEITKWDKEDGPKLSNYMTSKENIDNYVDNGEIDYAGNAIRKYYEDVLHNICETNKIPLPLAKHYSAEEYLNPIKSFKNELFKDTEYESYYNNVFQDLDSVTYIGNLLSHRNDSAKDLTIEDIIKYRDAVYNLEKAFKCDKHKTRYLRFNKNKKYGECTNSECDYILFLRQKEE